MAYLGNVPARSFISFERQVFTIVNSQTAYTLSHSVTNENDIRLVVNNVVQEPGSGKAYTATGTTLTLSAALTNGTDEMYCVFLGRAVGTVNAPAGSVGTSQLAADAVTNAKIADDAISDEQLDPTVITGQTAETTIASDDLILLSDTSASGALKKMTQANFVSGVGGTNTPSWLAYLSSTQTISNTTSTTIVYNAEVYDTANAYNTSNGKFTVPSGQGGKYFLTFATRLTNWNTSEVHIFIQDGGSGLLTMENGDSDGDNNTFMNSGIVDLSAGDTIEVQFYQNGGNGAVLRANQSNSWFGGFKLIGV